MGLLIHWLALTRSPGNGWRGLCSHLFIQRWSPNPWRQTCGSGSTLTPQAIHGCVNARERSAAPTELPPLTMGGSQWDAIFWGFVASVSLLVSANLGARFKPSGKTVAALLALTVGGLARESQRGGPLRAQSQDQWSPCRSPPDGRVRHAPGHGSRSGSQPDAHLRSCR